MDLRNSQTMYYMWTVNANFFLDFHPHEPPFLYWNSFNQQNYVHPVEEEKKVKSQITYESEVSQPKKKIISPKTIENQEYKVKQTKKKKVLIDQKLGRNVYSNIFRSFFKFMEISSIQQLVGEILQKSGLTRIDILEWFQKHDIQYRNYIRFKSIKNMLRSSPQNYVKTFIQLLSFYLEKYARLHFLNSQKLKQKNKLLTLNQIRQIKEEIYEQFIIRQEKY